MLSEKNVNEKKRNKKSLRTKEKPERALLTEPKKTKTEIVIVS